jgi:hypothetical protein
MAMALALSCATGVERFGAPIPADRVDQIVAGRSTRNDVLSLLGPPTFDSRVLPPGDEDSPRVVPEPREEVLLWEYRERRERFATVILYTFFSQKTLTDTVMVLIDDQGVVSHVAVGRETNRSD